MPDEVPFTADRVADLMEVLRTPEHQAGLEETTFTVVSVADRAAGLIRVSGTISGTHSLQDWAGPNIAVRLSLPERSSEFAGIDGAPDTTARVYTVADVDIESRTVAIDIVRHGESSPAMKWLGRVRSGDVVPVAGPRPHRVPGSGSPRILLADSSALPAAVRILTRLPIEAPTVLVAAAPLDEIDLVEGDLGDRRDFVTVQRAEPGVDRPLATTFAGMEVPAGASVWAAGEREDVREVRRRCRDDLVLAAEGIQVFGYWKRGISNTRIDVARLEAARSSMEAGRGVFATDDLDIEI
ncbi:siderophore-interacting protein [Rhodococcus artemisiae]|uniref:SIP domain-containing protein n=1 Tax=Rhodococcus artemisiae TaxID=714159 RepID=A0ABU7LGQ5_9NOCA|nr:SIP domain-containing protein [Rhodococcus artemisiae]MEE2060735.1 SIP domain-containing protein [Rhodococcus artemisiae]